MCYDYFMEPESIDQSASLIPPSVVASVTASVPLPNNLQPTTPQNISTPKIVSKKWPFIVFGLIVLALVGLNIFTYQQLNKSKTDLKTATDDNSRLTAENVAYKALTQGAGVGTDESIAANQDKSANTVIKNNARSISTGLDQYYLDNGDKYPLYPQKSGVDVEGLAESLSGYLAGVSVFQHQQQALYISSDDGKYYVQAYCLAGEYDPPALGGNGVYNVTNGSITLLLRADLNMGSIGNTVALGLICKQAFVTYGPQ